MGRNRANVVSGKRSTVLSQESGGLFHPKTSVLVYQLIDPLKIREDLENVIVSDLFMMILWKYFDPILISICQNLD